MIAKTKGLALLGAACVLAGCEQPAPPLPAGQYALPVHEAYQRLVTNKLPDFMANRQCGVLIHNWIQPEYDRSVTWHVTSSGREMLNFTAALTPVDDLHTKVDISVSKEADGREAYSGGGKFYARPAVAQPVRPAIEEQVAALFEGRPFDPAHTAGTRDPTCNVQLGGLKAGTRFSVDDRPSMSADETIEANYRDRSNREERERRRRLETDRVVAPRSMR